MIFTRDDRPNAGPMWGYVTLQWCHDVSDHKAVDCSKRKQRKFRIIGPLYRNIHVCSMDSPYKGPVMRRASGKTPHPMFHYEKHPWGYKNDRSSPQYVVWKKRVLRYFYKLSIIWDMKIRQINRIKSNEKTVSAIPNVLNNSCFKLDFQKVD